MSDEVSQTEPQEIQVDKPKRGRPRKPKMIIASVPLEEPAPVIIPAVEEPKAEEQVEEAQPEVTTAEPVLTPQVADQGEAEPQLEPDLEPEPVKETKTPRRGAVKREASRPPRKRKVEVRVQSLGSSEQQEVEDPNLDNYYHLSPADRLAMHMAQSRVELRRQKSERYKALFSNAL